MINSLKVFCWKLFEWSFLLDIDPSSPNISGNASGFLRCWLYYWYFKIEIKSCSICRTPISMSITRWRPWRGNRLRLIDRQESWRPSWGKSWENVRHPHSPPQPNSIPTLYLWLKAAWTFYKPHSIFVYLSVQTWESCSLLFKWKQKQWVYLAVLII